MRPSPPYIDPAGNPETVMSLTSYSPGPRIAKGCLSPRAASSPPFMSGWLSETIDTSAPKFTGLKFLELLETGQKTGVVPPADARTQLPSWNVKIMPRIIAVFESLTILPRHVSCESRAPLIG